MNPTDLVDQTSLRSDIPEFAPGDTLKVHVRVVEGQKERVQVFQGLVIGRSGSGLRETFKVRKVSYGVGVERTFPLHAPTIAKIERVSRGDVRRAKLYYLRGLPDAVAQVVELGPANVAPAHPLDLGAVSYTHLTLPTIYSV